MKGSKKGFLLSFLLKLVMGIALVVAAVMIAKSLFRLSSEGLASFNELADKTAKLADGELDSMALRMDKDTAILAFAKGAAKIDYMQSGPDAFFERPSSCEANKACLCLCRGGFGRESLEFTDQKLVCGEASLYCREYADINFIENPDKPKLAGDILYHLSDYTFAGGFMFERGTSTNLPRLESRIKTLYAERKGYTIGICFTGDCI